MSLTKDIAGNPVLVPWIVGNPTSGQVVTYNADAGQWQPKTTINVGTATLNFGASMAQEATVTVTGQTAITASSRVWAWLIPAATADHSADEVMVNPPAVFAGNIVAGTGFTIYGNAYNLPGSECYGSYSIGWAWV